MKPIETNYQFRQFLILRHVLSNIVTRFAHDQLSNETQRHGLCFHVRNLSYLELRHVANLEDWELFSGDDCYPVPHKSMNPVAAFHWHDKLFEATPYGRARVTLASWLLDQVSEAVKVYARTSTARKGINWHEDVCDDSKQLLVNWLRVVATNTDAAHIGIPFEACGLCVIIPQMFYISMSHLNIKFEEWEHFSGDHQFPVKGDSRWFGLKTNKPSYQYTTSNNHYKGDYGARRKKLAMWMASKIENSMKHEG